ncbi:gastrula zinc finger protein XlCGF57.1 isoform X1 [Nothobranchius furzeri]|uniref:gastrula zinc finger protein XlCGF57.1 isoform X1 n=1 Tax=Nothobranchius furzeri TaxID=105023 RepID=UPI003904DE66
MDTDVLQMVKEEASEDQSAGVDQQHPEQFHIKEEQEELWTSLEGEQLLLKKETNSARFPFISGSIKSEDDEDKPLVLHLLYQQQIEDRDVPTNSSADQTTAETGREAESSRNPVLNPDEQISDSSETEVSGDDVNLNVELLDSSSETGDGDTDCNESRSSESDIKTVNKSFCCLECGKEFLHKWSLQRHERVTSHSAIRSSGCVVNKKNVRVKQHVDFCRKVQNEPKTFSCDICHNHNKSLNRHMRVHTREKPFACELCEQRFRRKFTLNRHMRVHTGQKLFECELCEQRFSRKFTLNRHMRVHTGQKLFACELCEQRFSQKSTLNTHMRVHTGQKPFVCELCGQRFSFKQTLDTHMRIHTGQKPYACELCEQRFSQKSTLNSHMRIHTGQKPFACEICGKSFTLKTNLNSHMRVHTGQKPFVCERCGKSFNRRTNLNTHMRVHTGQKLFACELCGQRFSHKKNLNSHMRVHKGHYK